MASSKDVLQTPRRESQIDKLKAMLAKVVAARGSAAVATTDNVSSAPMIESTTKEGSLKAASAAVGRQILAGSAQH